jgi:8-oxo-dGTP pyrophosphatase MutT (NUDIX family)
VKYKITIDFTDRKNKKIVKSNFSGDDNMNVKGVSLVIVFNKHNQVLLARRKNNPFKGEWSIPGGHIEPKEKPIDAAIREIKEECGISLSKDMKMIKLVLEDKKQIMFFATRYFGDQDVVAGSDALGDALVDADCGPACCPGVCVFALEV